MTLQRDLELQKIFKRESSASGLVFDPEASYRSRILLGRGLTSPELISAFVSAVRRLHGEDSNSDGSAVSAQTIEKAKGELGLDTASWVSGHSLK